MTRLLSIALLGLALASACHRARDERAAAAGGLRFGEPCTSDSECVSKLCFTGMSASFCSRRCTEATAARDCPVPPTSGQCNRRGYCKKP